MAEVNFCEYCGAQAELRPFFAHVSVCPVNPHAGTSTELQYVEKYLRFDRETGEPLETDEAATQ